MKNTVIKWSCAALLGAAMTTQALAQNAQDALETVKNSVTVVLSDLRARESTYRQDHVALNRMIDSKIVPYFDTDAMARLVLASNWKNASKSQQRAFINEFKQLILRKYSTALLDYTRSIVTYGKPTPVKKNRTQIAVTITNDNGKVYPVVLSMGYRDGKWRAYDVSLDGLSAITSYRSSLGEEVAQKGLQRVIDEIKTLNATGKVE